LLGEGIGPVGIVQLWFSRIGVHDVIGLLQNGETVDLNRRQQREQSRSPKLPFLSFPALAQHVGQQPRAEMETGHPLQVGEYRLDRGQ